MFSQPLPPLSLFLFYSARRLMRVFDRSEMILFVQAHVIILGSSHANKTSLKRFIVVIIICIISLKVVSFSRHWKCARHTPHISFDNTPSRSVMTPNFASTKATRLNLPFMLSSPNSFRDQDFFVYLLHSAPWKEIWAASKKRRVEIMCNRKIG